MKALCWHGKSDVRVDSVPDVPQAYTMFRDKENGCIKVVLTP